MFTRPLTVFTGECGRQNPRDRATLAHVQCVTYRIVGVDKASCVMLLHEACTLHTDLVTAVRPAIPLQTLQQRLQA